MLDPAAPTGWRTLVLAVLALTAASGVLVLALVWPAVVSTPHSIPVSLTATSDQITAVGKSLNQATSGPIDLQTATSRAEAVRFIERRETLGAIILGDRPEVLVASAASPAVAQLLTDVARHLQDGANAVAMSHANDGAQPAAIAVTVTDVAPFAATDPRGAGWASLAFPLVIVGLLGALAIALLIRGNARRVVAVAAYSVLSGSALAVVLQGWLPILQRSFGVNLLALSLLVAAMVAFIVGAHSSLGRMGLIFGMAAIVLLASPIAASTQPVQFLPLPWGEIGQLLPPGAGLTLLQDLSYFPQANTLAHAWLALAVSALVGLALTALGLRARRSDVLAAPSLEGA